jgi:hypothetical protein
MRRAGQTPHGARPNREGPRVRPRTCRLGASQPPGRSLEPRSNAWPRGMTVLLEQSSRQNSAYRSGCHNLIKISNLLTRARRGSVNSVHFCEEYSVVRVNILRQVRTDVPARPFVPRPEETPTGTESTHRFIHILTRPCAQKQPSFRSAWTGPRTRPYTTNTATISPTLSS